MRKLLRFIKNTEGQALVESALVLAFVLIPLILGMIEFGWILDRQIILTNVAREGARAAVVCATEGEAEGAVSTVITNSGLSEVTLDVEQLATSWGSGEDAKVILNFKIKPIVGLYVHPDPADGTITLTATAVMRIEKY